MSRKTFTSHACRHGGWCFLLLAILCIGCTGDEAGRPVPQPTVPDTPAASADEAPAGPLVAFLGDSISAGLHVDEQDAFPSVLAAQLAERGKPIRLLNAGRSGDTSAGGLRRLDWILSQKPAYVVVELGANDGLRGQPVDEISRNLLAIVEKIDQAGAVPVLLGMRIPTNYGENYTEAFAGLFEDVAREKDVAFVPFFMDGVAGVPELNHADGIHPTAEGHRLLAANLLEFFVALLDPERPPEDGDP